MPVRRWPAAQMPAAWQMVVFARQVARPDGRGRQAAVLARRAALLAGPSVALFARAVVGRPGGRERQAADPAPPGASFAARCARSVALSVGSVQRAVRPVCPEQPAADLAQPVASPDGRDARVADPVPSVFAAASAPKAAARSARRAVARCVWPQAAVAALDVLQRVAGAVPDEMPPEAEVQPAVLPRPAAAVQVWRPAAVQAPQPAVLARALRQAAHRPFSSLRAPVLARASFRTDRIAVIARLKAT